MRKQIKKMFSAVVTACLTLGLVLNTSVATAKADSSSWNFKNSEFKNLGTISSTVTVDGLTLVATSSKTMSVVSDSQTVDGTAYSHALALGGGGSTSYRAVKVPVSGTDTIKVVLKSTGTSSRTLVVADAKGNTLGTLTAAATASLQSYSYSGASGYVYLYSSGSGINLYKIQVDSKSSTGSSTGSTGSDSSTSGSSSTSWNFKDNGFKSLGTISSNVTVDNLTLVASSSKTMSVKSESVTVDGTQYTYALALGGTGDTTYRAVKVPVSGASTIKVVLRSSGSSTRTLVVADASGKQLGTISAGSTASTGSYKYTGSAGYVYLYSSGSGINLYKIQVDGSQSDSGSSGSSDTGSGTGSSTGSDTGSSGTGSGSTGSSTSTGTEIIVKNGGTTLATAVKNAKKGTTIVIDGTIKSGAVSLPAGVNITGKNNATIDFSQTSGSSGRGITISGDGSTIENITVKNAADNGIFISGSNNTLKYVTCCYNKDAGFQVSNGGANNKFYNCTSHHNADAKGENADGFAVKLHSGEGNYFENCIAEYNSDDGWDCYAAHGAVKLVNCQANYNGYCDGIYGDGNGFKMGGVDNKTSGVAAHLDPLNHVLIGCSAKGNYANGFDRNNQSGVVTMQNCVADSNKGKNYNWPLTGKPSALGYEVTFGKAIIQDCVSKNGTNNIKGATLKGTCTGF